MCSIFDQTLYKYIYLTLYKSISLIFWVGWGALTTGLGVSEKSHSVLITKLSINNIITRATCGSTSLGFGSVFFFVFFVGSRNGNYCIIPSGFAKLRAINKLIFTRAFQGAFFLRFPDHLINLFEVKCSFLDKLTHSQT